MHSLDRIEGNLGLCEEQETGNVQLEGTNACRVESQLLWMRAREALALITFKFLYGQSWCRTA